MPGVRELTHDQVRELVRLRKEDGMKVRELVALFHVSPNTVTAIMRGLRFSRVTGIKPTHSKHCRNCVRRDIRQENLDAARDAVVTVTCHVCHGPMTASAGHVLNVRGAPRCPACTGKKRQ